MKTLPSELWLDLIGKPYVHGARGFYAYDCYGLVREILMRRGLDVPDETYDDTDQARNAMIDARVGSIWKPVPLTPGVVLVFGMHGVAAHCGVAVDQDRFIHASEAHRAVVMSQLSKGLPPFRKLLIGSYDLASAV